MKAYQLLNNSAKLARGNYAVSSDKMFTNPSINPDTGTCKAEKWDACGAFQNCYSYSDAMKLLRELEKRVLEIRDEKGVRIYNSWVHFNDNANYADIYKLLESVEFDLNLTPL